MFLNLGPMEVLVILIVALLVLGPAKLPEAARSAGRAIGELRRMSSGFQAELRDALQEPVDGFKPKSAELPTERARERGGEEDRARERGGEDERSNGSTPGTERLDETERPDETEQASGAERAGGADPA